MEIKQLALVVTDYDLNQLATKYLPRDFPVVGTQLRVAPEGLSVSGKYPLFVQVPFETLWELDVVSGKVSARLTKARAMGVPVTVFMNMFLKILREAVAREPWLEIQKETMVVDVERLLAQE